MLKADVCVHVFVLAERANNAQQLGEARKVLATLPIPYANHEYQQAHSHGGKNNNGLGGESVDVDMRRVCGTWNAENNNATAIYVWQALYNTTLPNATSAFSK
jgi:hypothetical protein